MIAALDSSTLRRLLDQKHGHDVEVALQSINRGHARLPPIVVTEILSQPGTLPEFAQDLVSVGLLAILPGYWSRAGVLRASVLRDGHKARLADSLIAQSCIDHDVPLITYDRDFRHFTSAGLKLL